MSRGGREGGGDGSEDGRLVGRERERHDPHTLSYPSCARRRARTSLMPAKADTCLSPIGSETNCRCFCEVVAILLTATRRRNIQTGPCRLIAAHIIFGAVSFSSLFVYLWRLKMYYDVIV